VSLTRGALCTRVLHHQVSGALSLPAQLPARSRELQLHARWGYAQALGEFAAPPVRPSVRLSASCLLPPFRSLPARLPARPSVRPLSSPPPPPPGPRVPPGPSTFFVYPSFFLPPHNTPHPPPPPSSFLLAGDYFPFPSRRPRRVTCEPPLLASHTDAPGIRVCVHASAASPRPAPARPRPPLPRPPLPSRPRSGDATRSLGSASHRARRARGCLSKTRRRAARRECRISVIVIDIDPPLEMSASRTPRSLSHAQLPRPRSGQG